MKKIKKLISIIFIENMKTLLILAALLLALNEYILKKRTTHHEVTSWSKISTICFKIPESTQTQSLNFNLHNSWNVTLKSCIKKRKNKKINK